MLQIVQGSYFRQVPLTKKTHRSVFYTNLLSFNETPIDFVFGRILPSTNFNGLRTLTIEANEQLEAESLSGQREILVATSGDQLLDEIADVIAFYLNVTCVRDYDMARRLISTGRSNDSPRRGPASLLRQTFDGDIFLSDQNIKDLDCFIRSLVKLKRSSYVAALRAIRQIVAATLVINEDAALAYTLIVAALESLAQATDPKDATWLEYDPVKRKRIDDATEGVDDKIRDGIRDAVLANEHLGLQRRFVAFVLGHIEPSYYRAEAVTASQPIKATDLPAALRQAYVIRSKNVHALEGLSRELWMIGDRSDTAHLESGVVLTPEGLSRLSRHVVRQFVERQPKEVDKTFNYRSALPGIVSVRLAAKHWIGSAEGFEQNTADLYFSGLLDCLIELLSGRDKTGLVDMRPILEKIENTALGISKLKYRLPMAGIMQLWNAIAPVEHRRTLKPKLQQRFEEDLSQISIESFAISKLLGHEIIWSIEELAGLSDKRRKDRFTRKFVSIPTRIDAALHIVLSDRFLTDGNIERCIEQIAYAVETAPGLPDLIKFEDEIKSGRNPLFHMERFILGEDSFVDSNFTIEMSAEEKSDNSGSGN